MLLTGNTLLFCWRYLEENYFIHFLRDMCKQFFKVFVETILTLPQKNEDNWMTIVLSTKLKYKFIFTTSVFQFKYFPK